MFETLVNKPFDGTISCSTFCDLDDLFVLVVLALLFFEGFEMIDDGAMFSFDFALFSVSIGDLDITDVDDDDDDDDDDEVDNADVIGISSGFCTGK
jgi:hypothetical protein